MKILVLLSVVFLTACSSIKYDNSIFHYSVPQEHQPNCVVGAFCMYANEMLNVKTSPLYWQTNKLTKLEGTGVELENIIPAWNRVFINSPLTCIYDSKNSDLNIHITFKRPYMWIGKYSGGYHACLIYFQSNSVTYKHFIYYPLEHTNYMVTVDYISFFTNTLQIYDIIGTTNKN